MALSECTMRQARASPIPAPPFASAPPLGIGIVSNDALQARAVQAFAEQDFQTAVECLSQLVAREPNNIVWLEGRAQALVDGKQFRNALSDYNKAVSVLDTIAAPNEGSARARLLSGRALVYEALAQWPEALADYNAALAEAVSAGYEQDPYILNSRGNVRATLGDYEGARDDYLVSARLFQTAKGFRNGSSTTQRLDGAIYASSNAALMLVQLGDDAGALREVEAVRRRAPNSADMRAALAALYWARGETERAEDVWEYTCGVLLEGCARYRDEDYLQRVRRWPPAMIEKMRAFLSVTGAPA